MAKKFVRTTKEVWDNKNDKSQYNNSIVFIEDTKLIWSNDVYYGTNNNQNSIDITYSELKTLRDNSQLIPGMYYRIIDYITTTIQEGTQSAGHQFSIIVTADSENVLSLIARASNEYIIKTLRDRAGFDGGGGSWTYVNTYEYNFNMYYMYKFNGTHPITDQDCYILIYKLNPIDTGVDYLLAYDYISIDNKLTWQDGNINTIDDELTSPIIRMEYYLYNALLYFANSDLSSWELKYSLDNDTNRFEWADTTNGMGVIYYMKDEYGNECPYDFKNIQFVRTSEWFLNNNTWYESIFEENPQSDKWFYTFSWINENGDCEDLSIIGNNTLYNDEDYISGVFGNKILECSSYLLSDINNSLFALSKNIFVSSYLYEGNIFYGCYSNTFGNNCYSNTFGNNFNSNTFGNYCYSNTFGNNCNYNSFGNYCNDNTFGNNFNSNTFGNNCNYNTFGNYCNDNTFGNNFNSNTFGNYCYSNMFGNECYYIKLITTNEATTNKYQYYKFTSGLRGLVITLLPNLEYETKVAKKSNGKIVIYNEADLIADQN